MLQILEQNESKLIPKIFILVIAIILVCYTSTDTIRAKMKSYKKFDTILQEIKQGPKSIHHQIPFANFLPILFHSPFRGTWQKSIRRSGFVDEEQGIFQMRALYNNSRQSNPFDLRLIVYDGGYRDHQFFDITISGDSLVMKQKFQSKGEIFYQTYFPLIGQFRRGNTFNYSSQQPLYINKIKIQINAADSLAFQFLLSSQYNLNIVTKDLKQYYENLNDLLFALLITVVACMQIVGIYFVFEDIYYQKQSAERYSFFGIMCATIWDAVFTMYVYTLCFANERRFSIFIIPAMIASFKIMYMEMKALQVINAKQQRSQIKFYIIVYSCLILGCLIAYVSNLRFVFMIGSVFIMLPQIIHNYIVGHRLKGQFTNYLLFALPRYVIVIYMRSFPANIFLLEPHYIEVFICFLLIGLQVTLLYIQRQYGVRTILPKFLYFSQFKYFMNEPLVQENQCSICLNNLRDFQSLIECQQKNGINKIVLTPCNHRFHLQCLANWMQTKLDCPNCRTMLPPIQQCQ